jgi:hypothetical protein
VSGWLRRPCFIDSLAPEMFEFSINSSLVARRSLPLWEMNHAIPLLRFTLVILRHKNSEAVFPITTTKPDPRRRLELQGIYTGHPAEVRRAVHTRPEPETSPPESPLVPHSPTTPRSLSRRPDIYPAPKPPTGGPSSMGRRTSSQGRTKVSRQDVQPPTLSNESTVSIAQEIGELEPVPSDEQGSMGGQSPSDRLRKAEPFIDTFLVIPCFDRR